MSKEKELYAKMGKLQADGYRLALAVATEAEVKAGAACGQLSLVVENM